MRGPVRSTGQAPASRPSLTTVRVHRIPNLTEPPPPPTTLGRPFQRKYRQDPILASERMMRRFVNILALAEKGSTGAYSLHRLDVAKHLFYPSTAEAVAAARPAIERLGQLPAPCVSFQPPQQCTLFPDPPQLQWFALVSPRSSEGRILYGNTLGNIALYDADTNSVECMPSLTGLQEEVGPVRYGQAWHWDSLPPPPLATLVRAHAVLDGGRTICVSAAPRDMGTYCFDTVRREWCMASCRRLGAALRRWSRVRPRAQTLAGLCQRHTPAVCVVRPLYCCRHGRRQTTDADACLKYSKRPSQTPTEWKAVAPNPKLISLGLGRFCIVRVFQGARNIPSGGDFSDLAGQRFAVLTGAEMLAGSGDNNKPEEDGQEEEGGQGLQMVEHKSILYMFLDDRIDWVL
ncbi:hypothetical protein PVAP13_5KG116874 [Panicum virgatum]|uniref:Uncharacterized protein n=1 Tax=Panicum virgatum TaxID=38727 RepID=A0A8T0SC87_PANVG|nr:hypothetical protein PVAP13_5KG116874 [Panicum virgatum]